MYKKNIAMQNKAFNQLNRKEIVRKNPPSFMHLCIFSPYLNAKTYTTVMQQNI